MRCSVGCRRVLSQLHCRAHSTAAGGRCQLPTRTHTCDVYLHIPSLKTFFPLPEAGQPAGSTELVDKERRMVDSSCELRWILQARPFTPATHLAVL
jgi:hypothetical protein